uniref:Uncharacterized protein n=1 Tax=Sphaerodactylus townsendi TaxID=933632 RepID=A0ACB8FI43_9SAUR
MVWGSDYGTSVLTWARRETLSSDRVMYLDNKDDSAISRKLDMELTQASVPHHMDLLGDMAVEPISNNFRELKLLKEMMAVQGEPQKTYPNSVREPDCCITLGKDFNPLAFQGSEMICSFCITDLPDLFSSMDTQLGKGEVLKGDSLIIEWHCPVALSRDSRHCQGTQLNYDGHLARAVS